MLQPYNSFETNWLDKRYHYDNTARDKKVEDACLSYLENKPAVTILDIGSGTGSNCLYFLEKMPAVQNWIFVERDEYLSKYALERIKKEVTELGYAVEEHAQKLILQKENRQIGITYITDSFIDLDKKVDLSKIDLVTAGAVFDLLSFKQFVNVASVILENEIALLATMNYAEMNFFPEEASDVLFIEKYEKHMSRPQEFGKAMGKDCSRSMVKFFRKHQREIVYGASVWNLNGKEEETHRCLFQFMKSAITEMIEEEEHIQLFAKWLYLKKELAAEGKLKTSIQHYDIFVK